MTVVNVCNVCTWCGNELWESAEPGKKYVPGCTTVKIPNGPCNRCRESIKAKFEACRVSGRLERAVKVHLILAAAGLVS